jgi:hypothetical protein
MFLRLAGEEMVSVEFEHTPFGCSRGERAEVKKRSEDTRHNEERPVA